MITVAETKPFISKSEKLLSDDEKQYLISYLAEHPGAGKVIPGTNGLRKLRWAKSGNRGKKWRYSGCVLLSQRKHAALPVGSVC